MTVGYAELGLVQTPEKSCGDHTIILVLFLRFGLYGAKRNRIPAPSCNNQRRRGDV